MRVNVVSARCRTLGAGAVALALLASCAAATPPSAVPVEREGRAADEHREVVRLSAEVDRLSARDCAGACEAGERLCALATRICELAERDHDDAVADYCADGRARCERARSRLGQACSCQPGAEASETDPHD